MDHDHGSAHRVKYGHGSKEQEARGAGPRRVVPSAFAEVRLVLGVGEAPPPGLRIPGRHSGTRGRRAGSRRTRRSVSRAPGSGGAAPAQGYVALTSRPSRANSPAATAHARGLHRLLRRFQQLRVLCPHSRVLYRPCRAAGSRWWLGARRGRVRAADHALGVEPISHGRHGAGVAQPSLSRARRLHSHCWSIGYRAGRAFGAARAGRRAGAGTAVCAHGGARQGAALTRPRGADCYHASVADSKRL